MQPHLPIPLGPLQQGKGPSSGLSCFHSMAFPLEIQETRSRMQEGVKKLYGYGEDEGGSYFVFSFFLDQAGVSWRKKAGLYE